MELRRFRRGPLLATILGLLLAAVPMAAAAHAHLVSSSPEAGENLEEAPTEVTITFDDELEPEGSGFTVHDHDGAEVGSGEVDLQVAERNVLRGDVSISEPGVYTVEWTVIASDGDETSGSFAFGYATDEEIPTDGNGDGHENPDTAMAAPQSPARPLATFAGVLLLAVAGALAVRRLTVR
ncbi:MAG TPA: copper resistance CopC family protein [Candidatus Limnocylindria bacterium]|nr:copper resistance CopC family protein [Candidatus Limnocylindria bacterium]